MLYHYWKIEPDGVQTQHEVEMAEKPSYEQIKAVWEKHAKGYLEHVAVLHEGKPSDMFVDEEGLLKGLLPNKYATVVYWTATMQREGKTINQMVKAKASPIVGVALIFKERVWW